MQARLEALRDNPNQSAEPIIYHLDVGAMYPNIILTNRLQPPAIVNEQTCASCVHNKPESDCKRSLQWMWRGELFPSSMGESDVVRATLEYESVPNPRDPGGAPISFLELEPREQNDKFRSRLKEYCQKVYKKTHVTKMEERTAVTCQRENPFYIDTVRAFRDRRYEYKKLNKTWGKKRGQAEKDGDGAGLLEAKAMCVLYDSLQLAHKCILNSFYGYVMRKGARWYSMEMAGIVTYTGAAIIKSARVLVEQIGKTLELDTDGIWCVFPHTFPQDFTFKTSDPSKPKFTLSYPCTMLNVDVDRNNHNPQYQRLNDDGEYAKQREQSIFFEVDGPYKAMILPSSTEEGKLLKKRYAVYELDGSLAELKGFEIKRRGELKLIKVFQTEVFGDGSKPSPFLDGSDLESCYEAVAAVANRWVDVLESRGSAMEDDELLELVSEQKSMSKSLEEYGSQKSTAITVARRLAEFLGDQMVKEAGLACKYIIASQPAEAPVTERALPVAIFDAEEAVKVHYLRRWLKDRSLMADEIDIRSIIDWSYYRQRLDNAIQKIITIPAACQKVVNPVPRVKHPDWLGAMVRRQDDTHKQKDVRDMFKAAVDRGEKVVDVEDIMAAAAAECATGGKKPTVHRRMGKKGKKGGVLQLDENADMENALGANGGGGVTSGDGTDAPMDVESADPTSEVGSPAWLRLRMRQWRAIRSEKKRIRREQAEEEDGSGGMAIGGGGAAVRNNKRPGVGPGPSARGGLGSFYTDAAATLHGGHWQVLTVQAGAVAGELTAWVLLGGASAAPTMHAIPIRVPRQLYVNMRAPIEAPGWVKVSRTLPRNATPLYMYEVSMAEDDFLSSYADMAKWLGGKDVHAVYHSHTSPLMRLVAQLGCTCHVARGAPRRSPHDGFALSELRPSSHQHLYLAPRADDADDSASLVAPGVKKVFVYATGSGNRGVLAYHTPHDGAGGLILIRPRGSQLAADARQTLNARNSELGYTLTMEGVDTWEGAYGRLQRVLPGVQSGAKGPLLCLAQTKHTAAQLQQLVPALVHTPIVPVPHNNSDGTLWENGSLLLGGAWQAAAIDLALERFGEVLPWLETRARLARYTGLPIGCLPADDEVFACDVLMHRRLLQSGHLSWLSPTDAPDLGGHPAIATDGGGAQEIDSPEVSVPGMYRVVCVDLQLDNLAVNTVLESRQLHGLEGVDLSKDLVRSADTGDAAALAAALDGASGAPADDGAACASAFRTLKHLVHEWMTAVLNDGDPMADALLLNMYRWLCSPSSLMYDPALHRMLHLLMKKVWLQLLAEVRALGARVVYASFTRITIATDKASLHDGRAYVDFLLGSIKKKGIFSFLHLTPMRYWSTLLFLDGANYGGIGHRVLDAPPPEEGADEAAQAQPPADAPRADDEGIAAEGGVAMEQGAAASGADAEDGPGADADAMQVEEGATDEPPAAGVPPPPVRQQTSFVPAAPPSSDRATAMTICNWNLAFHLPPAIQRSFRTSIDLYVAEPWTKAAIDAEAEGRDAPGLEAVEAHAKAFFDDFFSMRLLEQVHHIRKTVPSTGDAERTALREGTATDDVIERSFPLIPGSHLALADPALEFSKAVCHLASLEPAVESQLLRLRRNLLRQLGVREFAVEGVWHNPSLSFVLPEVVCDFCGHCRDLDVCRENEWACGECGNGYNLEALEHRLVTLVQRRALAYQLQDVQCGKCRAVKVKNLSPFCAKCAGPFELRQPRKVLLDGLKTFANIAEYHEMPWLAETVAFFQAGS